MNVYDFDGTIFDGDCTLGFGIFCIKNKPSLSLRMFKPAAFAVLFALRIVSRERFKECYFKSFLPYNDDTNELVKQYWNYASSKIMPWYLTQKRNDDLIISASPTFILKPICDELNVRLIASEVDAATGKMMGKNCRGVEKLRRFKELYGDERISEFYTDSTSDAALAEYADKAFFVKGSSVSPFYASQRG